MSLTRLLAAWAMISPAAARAKSSGLKPAARTASSPAMAAEVSVIGCTQARVRTSQRLTWSVAPAGALQVDITTRQASRGLFVRAVSSVAMPRSLCRFAFDATTAPGPDRDRGAGDRDGHLAHLRHRRRPLAH